MSCGGARVRRQIRRGWQPPAPSVRPRSKTLTPDTEIIEDACENERHSSHPGTDTSKKEKAVRKAGRPKGGKSSGLQWSGLNGHQRPESRPSAIVN